MKKLLFSTLICMAKILFLLIFSLFFTSCFEKPFEKVTERYPDGKKKTSIWIKVKTAKNDTTLLRLAKWYANGVQSYEIPYQNGLPNGEYIRWNSLGYVVEKGNYKDGQLNGKQEFYFPKTKKHLRAISFYKNGKRTGTWTTFYDNGIESSELNYENDSPVGVGRYWYSNGNLKKETSCFGSNAVGSEIEFSEDGKTLSAFHCQSGVRNGESQTFYKNGTLKEKAFFKNGLLHGKKEIFFASGELKKMEFYNQNKRDSVWVEFTPAGDTVEGSRARFTQGSGRATGSCFYKNDFYICADSTFQNNQLHGFVRFLDIPKKLFYEEIWEHGKKRISKIFYLENSSEASHNHSGSIDFDSDFASDTLSPSPHATDSASDISLSTLRTALSDSLFSKNLKPAVESFWKNGKRHGPTFRFDAKGNLRDSLNFIQGERFGVQKSFDAFGNVTRCTEEGGKNHPVIYCLQPTS